MLKGKNRSEWNEFNDIEYIDIPKPKKEAKDNPLDLKEIRERSSLSTVSIAGLLFIGWLVYTIKHSYLLVWNIIFGCSILISVIYLISRNFIRKPFITLHREGISHKGNLIRWEEISNMYIRQEYTGEDYSFQLVIERENHPTKSIGLKWLNDEPKNIILSIGIYYWKWFEDSRDDTKRKVLPH